MGKHALAGGFRRRDEPGALKRRIRRIGRDLGGPISPGHLVLSLACACKRDERLVSFCGNGARRTRAGAPPRARREVRLRCDGFGAHAVVEKAASALPKDRITQPKVPQHSTLSSMPPSTPTCDLGLKMHPLTPLQHAHPTPTCLSHSNMPKSPVRAEIFDPEADICFVERSLRDLFDTPGPGSVCGGGRHQIGPRRWCFTGSVRYRRDFRPRR